VYPRPRSSWPANAPSLSPARSAMKGFRRGASSFSAVIRGNFHRVGDRARARKITDRSSPRRICRRRFLGLRFSLQAPRGGGLSHHHIGHREHGHCGVGGSGLLDEHVRMPAPATVAAFFSRAVVITAASSPQDAAAVAVEWNAPPRPLFFIFFSAAAVRRCSFGLSRERGFATWNEIRSDRASLNRSSSSTFLDPRFIRALVADKAGIGGRQPSQFFSQPRRRRVGDRIGHECLPQPDGRRASWRNLQHRPIELVLFPSFFSPFSPPRATCPASGKSCRASASNQRAKAVPLAVVIELARTAKGGVFITITPAGGSAARNVERFCRTPIPGAARSPSTVSAFSEEFSADTLVGRADRQAHRSCR